MILYRYDVLCACTQREKYYGDRTRSQLVKFALEHVRAEVIELWLGNFKSRVTEDDEPTTRDLPWLISFCTKNEGLCSSRSFSNYFVLLNISCL